MNNLLGLAAEQAWPVVARLSDWALQAPALPFLLAGRTTVTLPELLPAWRFFLLVSRWGQMGLSTDAIYDSEAEVALFANLGWESPQRIAQRILAMPDNSPASFLTRLYWENLRLAAKIRLAQPDVLSFPVIGDAGYQLQPVYSIFSDGMRGGGSGRFATDKDTWQIPYLLIDDAVIDALIDNEHLGGPLGVARLVSNFLTKGTIKPGMLVGRSLKGVLGDAAALRLLEHSPTAELGS